jgi:predicted transcriptional regulator
MTDSADILISLKPKYAEDIFSGAKTVELRKRRPHVDPGTSVWIYATAPVAALKGYARLERIVTAAPSTIWKTFGDRTGISKAEFDQYFFDCDVAHALVLSEIKGLKHPILLDRMRKMVADFHPPQFFCRLNGAVAGMRLYARKYQALKN